MRVQVELIDQKRLHLLYSLSVSARTTVDFFIITPNEHYWTFHERENRQHSLSDENRPIITAFQAYNFSKLMCYVCSGVSKEK